MSSLRPVCRCVDTHTHVVPMDFPAYAGIARDVPWPSMQATGDCGHRNVMVSGKVYRTVTPQCWDASQRLADMDARGVQLQVISAMPELFSYWMSPADGAAMCRYLNETIAAMVGVAPQRLVGLAAVPLQDIDASITMLEHAMTQLGHAGVEVGSNVNGKPIGHPDFAPFLSACERLGAAVFVHAMRPAGMERLLGPALLEQVVGFPNESGMAVASMITTGAMQRHPSLRIAFSHGGGSSSVVLPRMQHAWQVAEPLKRAITQAPLEAARLMYYDDILYDDAAIVRLIDLVGATQVIAGTDYPFVIMDQDPVGRIERLAVDASVREALMRGNALRWLGRTAGAPA